MAIKLMELNPTVFLTLENPRHGFFKEHEINRSLIRRPGWHLVHFDYFAMAMPEYDGEESGPWSARVGVLAAKKSSVAVVHRTGDIPQPDMLQCPGRTCRMVVPGTRHDA